MRTKLNMSSHTVNLPTARVFTARPLHGIFKKLLYFFIELLKI